MSLSSSELRFLFGYMRPYRGKFVVAMVALLFSSFAGLAFPGLIGALIDAVENPNDGLLGNLDRLAFFFLLLLLVQSGFSFVRTYYLQEVSERSLADLREELYAHILRLPVGFFHRTRVGDLTSRLSSDVTTIQTTMTTTLSELIRQTIILIGGISLVVYTSSRLTLVILGALPIVVGLAVWFGRFIRKASRRVQDLYADLNTSAEETFQGISIVKAFTSENRERSRFSEKLVGIIGISLGVAKARAAFIAFVVFILFGGVVAVIWYGGRLVQSGDLSIGELTSFVLYAAFVGGAMGSFADLYGGLQKALGAAEKIREILEETPEKMGAKRSPTSEVPHGSISFEGVSFSYPSRPEIDVLREITLSLPAGGSLALVGPSGSGKSTIVNLLLRFYDPDRGQICIDNREIREIDLHDWRSRVAVVPQEVLLFGGTIEANIRYGRPDATIDEVREAAEQANALSFITRFPEGLQTVVGERGVQLSGGERQRVAIARAILRDPELLILDEATSALDSESERLVQEALYRVMRNRTTIVIAHRLSTIRQVDMIAVLREGAIVERGSYDELLATESIFRSMLMVQDGGLRETDGEDDPYNQVRSPG